MIYEDYHNRSKEIFERGGSETNQSGFQKDCHNRLKRILKHRYKRNQL